MASAVRISPIWIAKRLCSNGSPGDERTPPPLLCAVRGDCPYTQTLSFEWRTTRNLQTWTRFSADVSGRSTDLLAPAEPKCNASARLNSKEEAIQMKTTDTAQATRTEFDGVLVTIRSRKSFFEVTQAIEKALPR